MIPVIEKSFLTTAKYTKLLNHLTPEGKQEISTVLANFGESHSLEDHFYARYRYYEICDINEEVFIQCVKDTFEEYIDYFEQLYTAYAKNISLDNITKKITERDDESHTSEENEGSGSSQTVSREYDLPNKVISQESEDGYLTGKDKGDVSSSSETSISRDNTYGSDITSTDNREFIRLKNQYLAHIRDLYEEFVEKFSDCFLHIY